MKNNIELEQKTVKPSDLLAAKVIQLAVAGYKKHEIAEKLDTSVSNCNRIIYGKRGQATLRKALDAIHENIGYTLPTLMDDAMDELHKILLTESTAKTRLEAVKVAVGLTLNLSSMAGGVANEQVIN